jgi:hypothetical protein
MMHKHLIGATGSAAIARLRILKAVKPLVGP